MATIRSFGNMLNQKPISKGILKEEKQKSPWLKMMKGK
jgi:hypothetical protein